MNGVQPKRFENGQTIHLKLKRHHLSTKCTGLGQKGVRLSTKSEVFGREKRHYIGDRDLGAATCGASISTAVEK